LLDAVIVCGDCGEPLEFGDPSITGATHPPTVRDAGVIEPGAPTITLTL
jgi:hypothetical protein